MSGHDDETSRDEGDAGAGGAVSRRALLAGTLSVGTIGALSGGSSVLLLTDENVAEGSTLSSPRMDLRIAWKAYDSTGTVTEEHGVCSGGFDEYAHDEASVELTGVEPGDRGALVVCARTKNEGRDVWARVRTWTAAENGRTKAERAAAADDEGDGSELPHVLNVLVRERAGCDYEFDDDGLVAPKSLAGVSGEPIPLARTDGSVPVCLALEWHLPESAADVVLTDSVEFGVEFGVAQRGRDGTSTNPWGGDS